MKHRQRTPEVSFKRQPGQEMRPKIDKLATPETAPQDKIDPWKELIGQEIVLQARGGTLYQGKLTVYEKGLLRLQSCQIQGANRSATVDWVYIDRSVLQHIHSKVQEA